MVFDTAECPFLGHYTRFTCGLTVSTLSPEFSFLSLFNNEDTSSASVHQMACVYMYASSRHNLQCYITSLCTDWHIMLILRQDVMRFCFVPAGESTWNSSIPCYRIGNYYNYLIIIIAQSRHHRQEHTKQSKHCKKKTNLITQEICNTKRRRNA